jgi:hypothetical protein
VLAVGRVTRMVDTRVATPFCAVTATVALESRATVAPCATTCGAVTVNVQLVPAASSMVTAGLSAPAAVVGAVRRTSALGARVHGEAAAANHCARGCWV